jgi:SAM-dependent methyltransferase
MSGAGQRPGPARDTQGRVGFEAASDVYERGRPGYQDDLVSFVVERADIHPGTRVLDLAAGTGKFTRQLLPFGAACIAVEPSASMREMLAQVVPGVPVVGGVGEAIPLVADSLQAVVVAQAFHWFDAPRALAEIARVLRPGGVLSLVWNERDEKDPVMIELSRMTWWEWTSPRSSMPATSSGRSPAPSSTSPSRSTAGRWWTRWLPAATSGCFPTTSGPPSWARSPPSPTPWTSRS